jgi:phospholipid-binding lipoprotein MlaA
MRPINFDRPSFRGTARFLIFLILAGCGLAGCATRPPASDPDAVAEYEQTNDPLEPTNRVFYAINNGLDTVLLRPAALAYRYVVPEPVRNGLHNMLANMGTPVQLANDVLEGKPRRAGDTTMRFLINTTVGIGGIFDVAKRLGYPDHDADFGMTMALWGVPDGPFLFLPVLGPTGPRDAAGFGVDIAMDPSTWMGTGPNHPGWTAFKWSRYALSALDSRERVLDSVDSIKKTALDPYATFRSLYRQHRHGQIEELRKDGRASVPVLVPPLADTSAK